VRETSDRTAALPRHDNVTRLQVAVEIACIAAAAALLLTHLVRLARAPELLRWWTPVFALTGALMADLGSGLIHWAADTWGSETMPVLGRRFLRPFRVHHVNPDDFLRREFADTNGDVSMVLLPCLVAALAIPLNRGWGHALTILVVAFCAVGLPTNQVHQWAHRPYPPRWVRRLQDRGIILSREEHRRHHVPPYVENYCIATGWCNAPLRRIHFFRRAERLVTRVTGLQPRDDESAFHDKVESWLGEPIGRNRAT